MLICEAGTGYTSIPAKTSAATEIVIEQLSNCLVDLGHEVIIIDIFNNERPKSKFDILEVKMPKGFGAHDYTHDLGLRHKLKRILYSLKARNVLNKKFRDKN